MVTAVILCFSKGCYVSSNHREKKVCKKEIKETWQHNLVSTNSKTFCAVSTQN